MTEKKDFYAKMKQFDDLAKHIATDPDHLKYDKPRLELLKQLIAAKAKIQDAREFSHLKYFLFDTPNGLLRALVNHFQADYLRIAKDTDL